ncbi:hypothetical protein K492DRAFT_171609 [Lichtheimia hyalospora FSU 10163]|nr:hypothetical protein K492DRAFT_171609 [Lichtheimia hyalospora FSU 10163]
MDLKFQGIYGFIEIDKLILHQDHQNFNALISLFQVLNMVEDIVSEDACLCKQSP